MSGNDTGRQGTAAGAAAACLLFNASAAVARADPKPPVKQSHRTNANYTEDVQSFGPAVTITLNGWPVAETQGGQVAGLINDSVIDGTNHLCIVITAPPGGKHLGPAQIATILIQNGDATVLSFKWKADAVPPQSLPFHKEITFQSGTHFGPRVWQNAPPITLDDATKQAIRAQVHRFRDTLDAKNLDGMVQMFAARDREDALSHGESPEQNAAAARKDYEQMLADPHWHMEPIRDDHLQFHLIADKRVVLVDYGNENGGLETVPDPNGDVYGFHTYLSLINGQ